uniref:Metalloendopeptidase n=1 Tax=Graphocephala atropunctata TaxID=36148 RepID=A0A1B6KMJ9_9HEMI
MVYSTIYILAWYFISLTPKSWTRSSPDATSGYLWMKENQKLGKPKILNRTQRWQKYEFERKSFLLDRIKHWPNSVVPYEIDPRFDSWEKKKIQKAIALFHSVSCVRFVPKSDERDYVKFVWSRSKCHSSLGRVGGAQSITLSDACFYLSGYRGSVVHEVMHALGFIHEHQRLDRDCYVNVTGYGKTSSNFIYISGTDTKFPYDYTSIMHYRQREYLTGRNGEKLGSEDGSLSYWDIKKLNYVYCGKPHFCDVRPKKCTEIEEAEKFCRVTLH